MKILLLVCAATALALNGTSLIWFGPPSDLGPHCVRATTLLMQAQAMPQQMPPPGNPHHVEPPPGQNCSRRPDTPPEKLCQCHRECKQNTDADGNPAPGADVVEDNAKCLVACFKKHCECEIANCE